MARVPSMGAWPTKPGTAKGRRERMPGVIARIATRSADCSVSALCERGRADHEVASVDRAELDGVVAPVAAARVRIGPPHLESGHRRRGQRG